MATKFQNAINTLLGYCKAKNKWQVDFEDAPYENLLQIASKYYGSLWSYDQFNDYLQRHLLQLQTQTINSLTAQFVIDSIKASLQQNLREIVIIAPLKGAWIPSSVMMGDFAIITTCEGSSLFPQRLPIINIVNEIATFTGFTPKKISKSISSITHARAKDFLSCPLLVIKRYGHYDIIGDISHSHYLLRYFNRFLRLLASYNNAKRDRKYQGWTKADQYFCIDDSLNYNHYPIRDTLNLNFDLTFLTETANQNIIRKIIDLFESTGADELQNVYFRSMKFFSDSLSVDEFSVDSISQQLLNVLISAETLLSFTTRGEKKSKLAHAMVGLCEIPEKEKEKSFKAVIEAYIDRSSLMHAGRQDVNKYIIQLQTSKRESESLVILCYLMSKILIKFPDWYNEISTQGTQRDLLQLWQKKIKEYIPKTKYNIAQIFISKLIVLLQKISKVRTEV